MRRGPWFGLGTMPDVSAVQRVRALLTGAMAWVTSAGSAGNTMDRAGLSTGSRPPGSTYRHKLEDLEERFTDYAAIALATAAIEQGLGAARKTRRYTNGWRRWSMISGRGRRLRSSATMRKCQMSRPRLCRRLSSIPVSRSSSSCAISTGGRAESMRCCMGPSSCCIHRMATDGHGTPGGGSAR